MAELSAEKFLREKLASEISSFGDGTTEFHTRDVEHLLYCLDSKDKEIKSTEEQCVELMNKINFNAQEKFKELLTTCMTINNLSAEERLRYIRHTYKEIWSNLSPSSKQTNN